MYLATNYHRQGQTDLAEDWRTIARKADFPVHDTDY